MGSALSALVETGFSAGSATSTAVHNCRYRPYIARQVRADSPLLTTAWHHGMESQRVMDIPSVCW